ncbi:aminoacyl-tRNA hydrolase [Mycoplasmopsis caviae]|uniref:Peptidyl-tRNA hydrolase n=1 Tax=Mycoplasmopsis caviae TaxID=55603 RepID=A0A3P8KME6_9BACT|nr:aminoacyl-tRNA hydrolase [Mycoplasmopsis caviae]UUD35248.1 aminoacyl-tRNA hydrolase [Mycoplasmopsis caviae]VDR41968.1 aminoacyl-tRNA hydrolase [Mycoplasmopsis caviae]
MKLIVGLGNPGSQYRFTRHNVGFLAIDKLCSNFNLTLTKEKFNGYYAKTEDFILAKPATYMNNSGEFVQAVASFYKINPADILVIHDEKDYEIGQAAIKIGGSSAGHNGVQSIINSLGNSEFKRLRIGIGKDVKKELKDYVLSNFTSDQMLVIEQVLAIAVKAAISFVYNDIKIVMNNFNVHRKGK